VASGSSLWSVPFKKTVFGIQPTYALEGRLMAKYAVDELKAQRIAVFLEYFPEESPGGYSLSSWAVGEVIGEALKRAGSNLDRESFIAALESLHDFSTGVAPPFSYSSSGISMVAFMAPAYWIPVSLLKDRGASDLLDTAPQTGASGALPRQPQDRS
jgi:hypothetical protein